MHAVDLEVVPCILEKCLDVALEGRESLFVHLNASRADESSKGHIAMRATVFLAINAESIELLLVDAPSEIPSDVGALSITSDGGFSDRPWSYGLSIVNALRIDLLSGFLGSGGSGFRVGGSVLGDFHDDEL